MLNGGMTPWDYYQGSYNNALQGQRVGNEATELQARMEADRTQRIRENLQMAQMPDILRMKMALNQAQTAQANARAGYYKNRRQTQRPQSAATSLSAEDHGALSDYNKAFAGYAKQVDGLNKEIGANRDVITGAGLSPDDMLKAEKVFGYTNTGIPKSDSMAEVAAGGRTELGDMIGMYAPGTSQEVMSAEGPPSASFKPTGNATVSQVMQNFRVMRDRMGRVQALKLPTIQLPKGSALDVEVQRARAHNVPEDVIQSRLRDAAGRLAAPATSEEVSNLSTSLTPPLPVSGGVPDYVDGQSLMPKED